MNDILDLFSAVAWCASIGLWIFASHLVSAIAEKKGREKWPWFFTSVLLSPVFGVLLLIAYPTGKSDQEDSESFL